MRDQRIVKEVTPEMMKRPILVLGIAAALAIPLTACSDNNNDTESTPTPTVTTSVTPSPLVTGKAGATQLIHLVCPSPVGTVDAYVNENDEDDWSPAYVANSETTLWPVAFGTITGTDPSGATFTDPPRTKEGADTTGAIDCTFTGQFQGTDEAGNASTATVTGSVTAVVK